MSEEGKEPNVGGEENPTPEVSNFDEDGTFKLDLSNKAEQSSPDAEADSEPKPETTEEVVEEAPVLEEIVEEITEDVVQEAAQEVTEEVDKEVVNETKEEAPSPYSEKEIEMLNDLKNLEGAQELISFLKETGGSVQDYLTLNTDFSKKDSMQMIKEHLKATRPNLSKEGIDLIVEDKYSFDADVDDEREIKLKKIAIEEAASDARQYFDGLKDKYYSDVKLNSQLAPEIQEKVNFADEALKQQQASEEQARIQSEAFTKKTNELFNDDFKGFEFSVGDGKKFRVNVKEVDKVSETQSNFMNVFGKYIDSESNLLKDAAGYHKALYAAENADKLAKHFYEQGMADATRKQNADAKNIDFEGRKSSDGVVSAKGTKVRVVSGQTSSTLSIKNKPKYI